MQTLSAKDLKLQDEVHTDFPEDFIDKYKEDGYAFNKKRKAGLFADIDFKHVSLDDGTGVFAGDLTPYRNRSSRNGGSWSEPVKGSDLILIIKKRK